jgi:hypothetical protein
MGTRLAHTIFFEQWMCIQKLCFLDPSGTTKPIHKGKGRGGKGRRRRIRMRKEEKTSEWRTIYQERMLNEESRYLMTRILKRSSFDYEWSNGACREYYLDMNELEKYAKQSWIVSKYMALAQAQKMNQWKTKALFVRKLLIQTVPSVLIGMILSYDVEDIRITLCCLRETSIPGKVQ